MLYLSACLCRSHPHLPTHPLIQAVEKKVEQKVAAVAETAGKRKGPLPMALAQLLLLGAYLGGAWVLLFPSADVAKVLQGAKAAAQSALKSAEAKLNEAKSSAKSS